MRIESQNVDSTIELGQKIAHKLLCGDVLILCGDLGAGKTHLSKGIAKGLGVQDEITSPTFNILRLYDGAAGYDDVYGNFGGNSEAPQLAHWDLYRLEDPDQLEDVDFFGILESGAISLVEWGDKFEDELPDEYLKVSIALGENDVRKIDIDGVGDRGKRLEEALREEA